MIDNYLVLNIDLVTDFTRKGKVDLLWAYACMSYFMRGLGYYNKAKLIKDFSKFMGSISKATIYRILKSLKTEKLLREEKGILYIVGKKALKAKLGISTKNAFRVKKEQLTDKKRFKETLITQTALLLQKRFRYAFKDIREKAESLAKRDRIQKLAHIPDRKEKVGVSYSKVSEFLGMSISNICKYAKRHTLTPFNLLGYFFPREINSMHKQGYFKENYHITWKWDKKIKRCLLVHKLPKVFMTESQLCRSKY